MLWKRYACLFIGLVCVAVVCFDQIIEFDEDDWETDVLKLFPRSVPHFPIRKDHYSKSNTPVSRGRFALLHNSHPYHLMKNDSMKIPLAKFKEILQCAREEPSINGVRGSIDLLRLLPPTREITELFCAYFDLGYAGCEDGEHWCDWETCRKTVQEHHNNPKLCRPARSEDNLVRIMNGKLYVDWPWCIEDHEKVTYSTLVVGNVLDVLCMVPHVHILRTIHNIVNDTTTNKPI